MVNCIPDIGIHLLTDKDKYVILACDGVWDVVSNEESTEFVWSVIEDIDSATPATSHSTSKKIKRQLVDGNDSSDSDIDKDGNPSVLQAAQALVDISLQAGSTDNISVLIASLPASKSADLEVSNKKPRKAA
jgi:serine/threonine protein phosphatase PrpC